MLTSASRSRDLCSASGETTLSTWVSAWRACCTSGSSMPDCRPPRPSCSNASMRDRWARRRCCSSSLRDSPVEVTNGRACPRRGLRERVRVAAPNRGARARSRCNKHWPASPPGNFAPNPGSGLRRTLHRRREQRPGTTHVAWKLHGSLNRLDRTRKRPRHEPRNGDLPADTRKRPAAARIRSLLIRKRSQARVLDRPLRPAVVAYDLAGVEIRYPRRQ